MTRLVIAAIGTSVLVGAYSLSPLVAVGLASGGAAVLTAAIAVALRQAERDEIDHVMGIIDACANADAHAEPVRLVS